MSSNSQAKSQQSLAQSQVSADMLATSGTLQKLARQQNKMDEILATADKEMNMGKQELENIDKFEKTLEDAREENQKKIDKTH